MEIKQTEIGKDTGQGNLLGIQPWVTTSDYASPQALFIHLESYLNQAKATGWINNRTIAVFPEYIGTWLVVAGEGSRILSTKNTNQAMKILVLRHPLAFMKQIISGQASDRLIESIFQIKANQMAAGYQFVFGSLAKEFNITVVAGSILLPNPQIIQNRVTPRKGALYNITAVFGPDGLPYVDLVRKIYPISEELPFVSAAPPNSLPTFVTPAGRLGVLICADSWYPKSFEQLDIQNVELIAVPSMISTTGVWNQSWQGYNGALTPNDVRKSDIGVLTEGQAWRKYGLVGRLGYTHANCGINVFLHGRLWEMDLDSGRSMGITTSVVGETHPNSPSIMSVWNNPQ